MEIFATFYSTPGTLQASLVEMMSWVNRQSLAEISTGANMNVSQDPDPFPLQKLIDR